MYFGPRHDKLAFAIVDEVFDVCGTGNAGNSNDVCEKAELSGPWMLAPFQHPNVHSLWLFVSEVGGDGIRSLDLARCLYMWALGV